MCYNWTVELPAVRRIASQGLWPKALVIPKLGAWISDIIVMRGRERCKSFWYNFLIPKDRFRNESRDRILTFFLLYLRMRIVEIGVKLMTGFGLYLYSFMFRRKKEI